MASASGTSTTASSGNAAQACQVNATACSVWPEGKL